MGIFLPHLLPKSDSRYIKWKNSLKKEQLHGIKAKLNYRMEG